MKRKIDYPYVVCILILVVAGVGINYLLLRNRSLHDQVGLFQKKAERLEQFYQQVTDLYFSGLQSCTIDVEKYKAASLKGGVVICLPTVPLDSLDRAAFRHVLARMQGLRTCPVKVWLYGNEGGEVREWVREYGYEDIYSAKKPAGIPDACIFYLDADQRAGTFFRIQPYAVYLVDKYIKFLKDHYR